MKRFGKKLLSLALAVCMVLGMVPGVSAEGSDAGITIGNDVLGLTNNTKVYDGTELTSEDIDKSKVTGSVAGANLGYAFTYKAPGEDDYTTVTGVKNVGDYILTATVPSDNAVYTGSATYAFTITPKELTVTGLSASTRYYKAGLNTVPISGNPVLVGAVNDEKPTLTIPIPSGTMADANAGTNKPVTVTLSLTNDSVNFNYTLKQPELTVTIRKAAADVTWPTGGTAKYGQTHADALFSDGSADVAGSFWLENRDEMFDAIGTKNVVVTFVPTDTANYVTSTSTNPAEIPITVSKGTWYDENSVANTQTYEVQVLSGAGAKTLDITAIFHPEKLFPLGATFSNLAAVSGGNVVLDAATLTTDSEGINYTVKSGLMVGDTETWTVKVTSDVYDNIAVTLTFKVVDKLTPPSGTVETPAGTVSGTTITATEQTVTGCTVEYAVSNDNTTAPTENWQTDTAFDGLTVGSSYYLWARTKETDSHFAGTAKVSAASYTIATPSIPAATAVTATVNGTTITADAITMSGYTVEYAISDGNTTAPTDGWQTTTAFANLAVGSSYYIWARVKASDTYPAGPAKVSASAYAIAQPGGKNPGGGTTPTPTPVPDSTILIDGKPINAGKLTVDEAAGETVLTLDPKLVEAAVSGDISNMEITIPLDEKTPSAVARIPAESIEMMQDSGATLTVTVGDVQYSLLASAIDLPTLLEQLSAEDASDVTLDIRVMPVADDATQREVAQALRASGGEAVVPAMQFEVIVRYGDESVSVNRFPNYVTRTVALTAEQAAQVTTAVVVDANGKARHVPTKLSQKDGEHFAEINSLTNSTYVLIHNGVSFPDIAGKWYEKFAQEMGDRKVISGYPDGTFSGDSSITRAEFAQILVNALGLPSDGDGTVLSDVSADAWYCGAVGTAYEYGLVKGLPDGSFAPNANITRQEAMQMMRNAAKIAGFAGSVGSVADFDDSSNVSDWALDAAAWSVGSGLISGYDGQLRPLDGITRAETAAVVLRLLQEAGLVDQRS